jgi:uncharacterized protein
METNMNPDGASSVAKIATPNAQKYLTQLCKHFQHKLPATWAESAGTIDFPAGRCELRAKDGELEISLASPDTSRLTQLQDVVARHLIRFAFREELAIAWSRPGA